MSAYGRRESSFILFSGAQTRILILPEKAMQERNIKLNLQTVDSHGTGGCGGKQTKWRPWQKQADNLRKETL